MPRPIHMFGYVLWFDHKCLYAATASVIAALIAAVTDGPISTGAQVVGAGGIAMALCSFGITLVKLWIEQRDKEAAAAERRDKEKWERHGIMNKLDASLRQNDVLKVELQHAEYQRDDLRTNMARAWDWMEKVADRIAAAPPAPTPTAAIRELTDSGAHPAIRPPEE